MESATKDEALQKESATGLVATRQQAHQIVKTLITDFAKYTQLEDAVITLQEWEMDSINAAKSSVTDEIIVAVLQTLLIFWDDGWEERKQQLLKEEDYATLTKLKATRGTLASWASEGAPPTAEEVLKEFQELKAIPQVTEWNEVETFLMTTEELMNA